MMETAEQFISRMANTIQNISMSDWQRLSMLATRGAKIPDDTTKEMQIAGLSAFIEYIGPLKRPPENTPEKYMDIGARLRHGGEMDVIYRAMLAAALKDTDNG
jgi:hypothetical protein